MKIIAKIKGNTGFVGKNFEHPDSDVKFVRVMRFGFGGQDEMSILLARLKDLECEIKKLQVTERSSRVAANVDGLAGVTEVAEMLACSERSVWRLSDAGKMPPPVDVGRLKRWSRKTLNEWIARGCPTFVSRKLRANTTRRQ